MKKLIKMYNEKYGDALGIIDDDFNKEQMYRIYYFIKNNCDDKAIQDRIKMISLDKPKTLEQQLTKLEGEHNNGLVDMTKGYVANDIGDFEILIDSEGNISNNNNPTSFYKKSNGQCYITWAIDNFPIKADNLVKISISVDESNYDTDMNMIYESTAKSFASSLKLSSGNSLTFQTTFRFNTKYTYLQENGTANKEDKQDTQSMILMFYSKDETLINKTIHVKYTIYTYNNSLLPFPSLKSTSLYSITHSDNKNETGIGSINLSSSSSPKYTFIMAGVNGHNEFKNSCPLGQIFGYKNTLSNVQFYNILGQYNTIAERANSSLYSTYINIIGQSNRYMPDNSSINYKPVSIIGNSLNVVNSGLYIGMGGTFDKDDIMGIADGTDTKENVIFKVKRDGRVKASIPKEDNDLTTKKYVDDKVASSPQLSFNESGELVVTINGVSKTFVPKSE